MTTTSTPTTISVDPATGAAIAEYPVDDGSRVDASLERAVGAQRVLAKLGFERRAEFLLAVAAELRAERERLAELIAAEMGKVLTEGLAEVEKSAWVCEYYAAHGAQHLAPEQVATEFSGSYVQFPPLGVVLAVMPWNYPVWQVLRAAAPAWMAGNTVVLKHASNVTGSALALRDLVERAAGPRPSPLEVVVIPGRRVAELIADPRVAAVTLTGSEAVGVEVASLCGQHLKKCVLELGGSDPFIVLADADVSAAADAAVTARFLNAGQSCIAGKRFIVADSVADEFLEAFTSRAAALRLGDPRDPASDLGPMARVDLRDDLVRQVERGVSEGGRIVLGGEHPEGPGAWFAPTIVADVDPGGSLAAEETFGPAAAVLRVADDARAIGVANSSPYGLSSSVWTRDVERARALAATIEAGSVFINAPSATDPRMPTGGVKRSGFGRELGAFGIREFVNLQAISIGPKQAR